MRHPLHLADGHSADFVHGEVPARQQHFLGEWRVHAPRYFHELLALLRPRPFHCWSAAPPPVNRSMKLLSSLGILLAAADGPAGRIGAAFRTGPCQGTERSLTFTPGAASCRGSPSGGATGQLSGICRFGGPCYYTPGSDEHGPRF